MGKSVFLAAVLIVLGSVAFAQHAISLEPEAAPAAAPEPAAEAPAAIAEPSATAPTIAPAPVAQPAPKIDVTLPSEHDIYLVPAAMREVCTTLELGFGEIRTECRTQPIPVRAENPKLRGLCVTRYGRRTCY